MTTVRGDYEHCFQAAGARRGTSSPDTDERHADLIGQ